jgi:hypothetical protein
MLLPALALLLVSLLALVIWRRVSVRGKPARQARGTDVRFSVYRPAAVAPSTWYDLLVFAHRTGRAADPRVDEPYPAERVRLEAQRLLGDKAKAYESVVEDSSAPVVPGTDIIVIPQIDGVQFQPPQVVMEWRNDVQRAPFQFRADARLDGTTARGQVSLFAGPLLLAEMSLVIRVSAVDAAHAARDGVTESVSPYRKVFASYSHRDEAIVRQMESYAIAFGDEYLRDVRSLRAGERWDERRLKLIDEADVFQLFWSWNALESEYVRREWIYALELGRKNFVRPVYWQDPLPEVPERNLPSPELRTLHFQRWPGMAPVRLDPPSAAAVPSPRASSPSPRAAAPEVGLQGRKRPGRATSSWLRMAVLAGVVLLSVTVVREAVFAPGVSLPPEGNEAPAPTPTAPEDPQPVRTPAPRPPGTASTTEIRQVIDRYVAALDRGSLPQLRRSFPSASARERRWRDLGDDIDDLSADGVVNSVEQTGDGAQARFRLSLTVKPTGKPPFTVQVQAVALLRLSDGAWTIVGLREPGP